MLCTQELEKMYEHEIEQTSDNFIKFIFVITLIKLLVSVMSHSVKKMTIVYLVIFN